MGSIGMATATDNCSGTDVTNNAPASFPEGPTTVTWTATDACGNASTCTQNVTVVRNTLSGKLMYNNPAKTPMNNVTLKLLETGAICTTATDGSYAFPDLCGGTYTIAVINNNKPVDGSINSSDAVKVLLWYVCKTGIERVKFMAGDVSNNNEIYLTDAFLIQKYFVHNTAFARTIATGTPWTYWQAGIVSASNPPTPIQLPLTVTVTGNVPGFDILAMVTGDFNESFIPNAAKSSISSVTLANSGNSSVDANKVFELPIRSTSSMEVGAVSLILNIPSDLVEVTGIRVNGSNESVDFAVNGNELRIGWHSATPVYIPADGNLLILKLKTKEAFTTGKSFAPGLVGNPLNELADGSVNVIENANLVVDLVENLATGTIHTAANKLALSNYPNPFIHTTKINYTIPVAGKVVLDVYTLLGQHVATLVNAEQTAGEYSLDFNGAAMQQGIYSVRLRLTNEMGILERSIKFVIQQK
jgi:hypothetical protein